MLTSDEVDVMKKKKTVNQHTHTHREIEALNCWTVTSYCPIYTPAD